MPEHMLAGQGGAGVETEGIQDRIQKTGHCSGGVGEADATEKAGRLAGAAKTQRAIQTPRAWSFPTPGRRNPQPHDSTSPASVYALIGIRADNIFV